MLFGCFRHVDEAAPGLANYIVSVPAPSTARLIRVEGVDGAGKTTLSKKLQTLLSGAHLEADSFRNGKEGWATHVKTARKNFQRATREALQTGRWAIVDSVCLDQLLPEQKFGRGFRIYVMQLRKGFDGFRNWEYGQDLLGDSAHYNDLDLAIRDYHLKFAPHCRADAIVQVPEPK